MAPPIAAVVGLSGSALAAGSLLCASLMTIPGFLAHPDESSENHIKAFTTFYQNGKALMPPTAIVSSIFLGVGAYNSTGTTAQLYTLAAVLTSGIVPYTLLFMMNTNNGIMLDKKPRRELKGLIKRWGKLNLGRAMFPLLGATAAGVAILELL